MLLVTFWTKTSEYLIQKHYNHKQFNLALYNLVFCRYRAEMDAIMARWRRLGSTLQDNAQRIQELMAKLMQFEVKDIIEFGQMICLE